MMILGIIIVSFIGLYFLIHICSRSNYVFEYNSKKRKIKIYPAKNSRDKSNPNTNRSEA